MDPISGSSLDVVSTCPGVNQDAREDPELDKRTLLVVLSDNIFFTNVQYINVLLCIFLVVYSWTPFCPCFFVS